MRELKRARTALREMMMRLWIVAMLISCGCVLVPSFAYADPPVPTNVYRSLEAGKPARNAGQLHGRIASVDYAGGSLVVQTNRGSLTVAVCLHAHRHTAFAQRGRASQQ